MASRRRNIFCVSCLFILLLVIYIIWPWLHAAYMWRESTVVTLNPSSSLSLRNLTGRTPRIIHQTNKDVQSTPSAWLKASNSCRTLHPNYKYYFWTDKKGRQLIEKEFPCLLATFDSYPYDIQRADVIRLVALYVYGGIYLDLDIICLKSLDSLLNYDLILPKTKPVGLSNDFIVAKPKHPFLLQVLGSLPKYNQQFFTKYPTVMFSTGPMFITHVASSYANYSSIDVLSPELYGKYVFNSSYSLFRHLKSSSWHGSDASAIKFIYRWRNVLLLVLVNILIISLVFIYLIHQYQVILNTVYEYYSVKLSNIQHTKLKEQTLIHKKHIQLFLLNVIFFYLFVLAFNTLAYSSFVDYEYRSA